MIPFSCECKPSFLKDCGGARRGIPLPEFLTFSPLKMDGWNTFSFPIGAVRPDFRGKLVTMCTLQGLLPPLPPQSGLATSNEPEDEPEDVEVEEEVGRKQPGPGRSLHFLKFGSLIWDEFGEFWP